MGSIRTKFMRAGQGNGGKQSLARRTVGKHRRRPALESLEPRCLLTSTLSATGTTLSETAGKAFKANVATFVTSDLTEKATKFKVSISWGDGSTSKGVVSANKKIHGAFVVTGSHTFSKASLPTETATILIRDAKAGATDTATATTNVNLKGGDISNIVTVPAHTMEGKQVTDLVVATFQANYKGASLSNFAATVNWGDGSLNGDATIVPAPGSKNVFEVEITHAFPLQSDGTTYYANQKPVMGPQVFQVFITDNALPRSSGGASYLFEVFPHIQIDDDPLVATATPTTIQAMVGQDTGFVDIGDFIDRNPLGNLFEYHATIVWGDLSPDTTVMGTSPGVGPFLGTPDFVNITYHHKYQVAGTFPITINVGDGGNSTLVLHSKAVVTGPSSTIQAVPRMFFLSRMPPPAPPLTNGMRDSADDLAYFTGIPTAKLSDYTFTVNWGDNDETPAETVSLNPGGGSPYVAIVANHTYADGGPAGSPIDRTITVTVRGPGIDPSSPLQSMTTAIIYQNGA